MENKTELELQSIKTDIKFKTIKNKIVISMFIVALVFEIIFIGFILNKQGLLNLNKEQSQSIGIIKIEGTITSETADLFSNLMEKAKDDQYKELIIVVNSGGGSPSASEEISSIIKNFNKPITMYVDGIAASGGYYIASAKGPINSNKNAIIGSIGVILTHFNLGSLADKIGIEEDNLAYGEFKQPISLFKKIDEKSSEYLTTNLLEPMYKNFLNTIAEHRKLPLEEVEKYAQGQIFIASDEKIKNILIDRITTLDELKKELKSKNGEIKFEVINEDKKTFKDFFKVKLDLNESLNISLK